MEGLSLPLRDSPSTLTKKLLSFSLRKEKAIGRIATDKKDKKFITVGDVARSRRRPAFNPEEHVRIVMPLMLSSDGGAAGVVGDDGKLLGILTEREVLRTIFYTLKDPGIHPHNVAKHIEDITVQETMIPAPEKLTEDIDIEDALAMMVRRGYRYMPVVNPHNSSDLIGIVSQQELALHMQHRFWDARKREKKSPSLIARFMNGPYEDCRS